MDSMIYKAHHTFYRRFSDLTIYHGNVPNAVMKDIQEGVLATVHVNLSTPSQTFEVYFNDGFFNGKSLEKKGFHHSTQV